MFGANFLALISIGSRLEIQEQGLALLWRCQWQPSITLFNFGHFRNMIVWWVASHHTKTPCWRIHKIWAGPRPHLLPMAHLHCLDGFLSFNINRFGPGELLVDVSPNYFTYLSIWIVLSKVERPIVSYLLLRNTKRVAAFLGLTLSPFSWHLLNFREGILGSFKTCINICTFNSNDYNICISKAPKWWLVSRFVRELATRFWIIKLINTHYG